MLRKFSRTKMLRKFSHTKGAFLIPYVLFVAIGSLPVFFLEVSVGQYTNLGSALAFRIVPIMKGEIPVICRIAA